MRSPFIRLAAAAMIVGAVVLGLFEFRGTGGRSGVAWAEVAQKVQASRGVVFRSRQTDSPPRGTEPDYVMEYLSRPQSRYDNYKDGRIYQTMYDNFDTNVLVLVDHVHKSYIKATHRPAGWQDDWADPNKLVQRFLACEHHELGRKMIDGMLCEGIETTDPSFTGDKTPPDSLMAQLWVSVESGYPVLIRFESVRNKGQVRIASTRDQFQWDRALEGRLFLPDIPEGYVEIPPP